MREEEKIEKYLFDADQQYKKMMRAYFKTQSYISKLEELDLNEEQIKLKDDIVEKLNNSISNRMKLR